MLGGLSRAKKIILVLVAVVVAITSSGGTYVLSMLNSYDHKPITSDKEDLGITNDDKSTDITNIALFGVDSRDSTQIKGNSDSIMIISVDKLHNKIKVISHFLISSLWGLEPPPRDHRVVYPMFFPPRI